MEPLQTDFTQDDKCSFCCTLITEHYSCAKAINVVRRGGSEISCGSLDLSKKCEIVYNNFKKIATPVFDIDDDLLDMPHAVKVKIQHGGLLGLNNIVFNESTDSISDISKLILESEKHFKSLDAFPYESTLDYITSYKVRRRRK
ncbi:hypothetical protein MNBD_GAMMA22-2699 [hydrothermal vent metagenome]|uniref:Uncharacterized protein n=1 Tax=hydrothermal vent metagenome TaxID=652676 RepID=A0A3B1AFA3_9ZZZZ